MYNYYIYILHTNKTSKTKHKTWQRNTVSLSKKSELKCENRTTLRRKRRQQRYILQPWLSLLICFLCDLKQKYGEINFEISNPEE